MPLSNDAVRQLADGLNTNFTAAQAALILALVNAAKDEAAGQIPVPTIPAPPAGDGQYVLDVDSGVVTWVAETT